ncbi:hypothetical protein HY523_01535 [Candidatus Berkelbacteria bacterium]|nr:hypothetical protein [Candidatus Berkelbacteria bacterium]
MARTVYLLALALPPELSAWVYARREELGSQPAHRESLPHLTLIPAFRSAFSDNNLIGFLGQKVAAIDQPLIAIDRRVVIGRPGERGDKPSLVKFALLAVSSSPAAQLLEIRRKLLTRSSFLHFYPTDPAAFSMTVYSPHITIRRNLTEEEITIIRRARWSAPLTAWRSFGIIVYRLLESGSRQMMQRAYFRFREPVVTDGATL